MTIRVMIVDDHGMVRQGMRMYLSLDPEFEIVGEAADGNQAIQLAGAVRPDVILMDLIMPGADGIVATRAVHSALPDTQVVAITSVLEDGSVMEAIRAGAIGYVLKDANPEELGRAVKAAAAGQVRLSPSVMARLIQHLRIPASPEVLTERESEVLRLVGKGLSNKEISRCLAISEKTVKNHVANILDKLGVSSRTQAALFAVRSGLVSGQRTWEPDPVVI